MFLSMMFLSKQKCQTVSQTSCLLRINNLYEDKILCAGLHNKFSHESLIAVYQEFSLKFHQILFYFRLMPKRFHRNVTA